MSPQRALSSLALTLVALPASADSEAPASWMGWSSWDRPALGLSLKRHRWQLGFEMAQPDTRVTQQLGGPPRQGFNLSLVATTPISPSLSLYGRIETTQGTDASGLAPREPALSGSLGLRWRY
jgi:hypothetical protein